MALTPDGRTLAAGDASGRIRLWDVADPAHPHLLGQLQTGSTGAVESVAFSPEGHALASGSIDGAIRLWNPNVNEAVAWICATAGDLTPQQWQTYIPQLAYQPLCAQ